MWQLWRSILLRPRNRNLEEFHRSSTDGQSFSLFLSFTLFAFFSFSLLCLCFDKTLLHVDCEGLLFPCAMTKTISMYSVACGWQKTSQLLQVLTFGFTLSIVLFPDALPLAKLTSKTFLLTSSSCPNGHGGLLLLLDPLFLILYSSPPFSFNFSSSLLSSSALTLKELPLDKG